MSSGWYGESYRHSLAAKGIKTHKYRQNKITFDKRTKYLDNTRDLLEETIILRDEDENVIGHGTLVIDHRNKTVYLAGIRTHGVGRGRGFSRLLMKEMVKVVDDLGYESELVIMPDEDSSLNEREIERICESFGFETIDDQFCMKRPARRNP